MKNIIDRLEMYDKRKRARERNKFWVGFACGVVSGIVGLMIFITALDTIVWWFTH